MTKPAPLMVSAADYECGFCERGQCARCSDKACTCCNGNGETTDGAC